MATAANMFPSADPAAPDLEDEQPGPTKSAAAFPSAPPASAFGKAFGKVSTANETIEIAATGTKIDRAIAYLRQNGPSDAAGIAAMLGIKRDHVSGYLKGALSDGRIVRDGGTFKVGDGKQQAPTEKPGATPAAIKPKDERPSRPPKVAGNDATVSASLCVGALQIIQWAAGNLTVRANDNVVDLSDAQVLALHAFLELAR